MDALMALDEAGYVNLVGLKGGYYAWNRYALHCFSVQTTSAWDLPCLSGRPLLLSSL